MFLFLSLQLKTYKVLAHFQVVPEVPDGLGPEAEHAVEPRADELRVELLRVLRLVEEADDGADHEAEHAGDRGVPHVGRLVDHQVVEAVAGGAGGGGGRGKGGFKRLTSKI